MKKVLFAVFCVITILTACDETTGTLGSSLTNTEDIVKVTDGTFKVTSRSVRLDSVYARSYLAYLGNVKDPETGVYVKGDFTTQFYLNSHYTFGDKDSLANGIVADSCRVMFYYNSFYGDSTNVMKATLCELAKPIEESKVLYSNFDPEKEGYVRTDNAIRKTISYSLADKNYTDSARNTSSYAKHITFNLNEPYTAKDGRVYSNYGTYIMAQTYEHPEYFKNSFTFAHNVCPGFYVKQQSGVGSMAQIWTSQFEVYYSAYSKDSLYHYKKIFAGTNEVTQSTSFSSDDQLLDQLAGDNTCTYLKSPSGICTELTLPVEDIIKGHENDTINSAKVVLKCFDSTSDNTHAFAPPTTVLMVQKDSLSSFFLNKKIANSRSSFLATYSSGQYSFGNIGQLVQTMYANLSKVSDKEAWIKEHPDWNKVYIIPVSASYTTYSSTKYLTDITNDLSLSSVKLVGGSANTNGDIEINIIYSKFQGQ